MEDALDDEDDAPMPDTPVEFEMIDMATPDVQLGALHRSAPGGDEEKPSTKKIALDHITWCSVDSRVRCPACRVSLLSCRWCFAQAPRQ